MTIISDFHNHISYTSAQAMVESARQRGLRIFGISEHISQTLEGRPVLAHMPQEGVILPMEEYRQQVLYAGQAEHFDVRLGLEVDFYPGKNEEIQAALRDYAWDFLIGSIHDVDALHFDRMEGDIGREQGEALWLRYFELLREAVNSGFFQVVSHPVRMRTTNPYLPPTFDEELERLAAEAAHCNVALELNGFDVLTYPDAVQRLIRACALQGTAISCGSDAHYPAEVAQAHAKFESILREANIRGIRIWKRQQPEEYAI
ncbi:PHP domain-containing protein [Dictyobacter formicarum]|uniref:Histidinol-phosphatase n=1 Tax=Dictyobacter formicarum TaxID=2778368 RepID=A0ABQ3VFU9_9CHLR|nr:PHP domain-containing protein [Dictyobacter formicarum]GHO85047.1 histidinol phosphate phosphatase HisJ [Dictyobacter formicarum]